MSIDHEVHNRELVDEVSKQPLITSEKKVLGKFSTKDVSIAEEEALKSSTEAPKQKISVKC